MGIDMDLIGTRKDGSEFPVEISLNHIGIGKEMTIIALITDITERKRVKADLERLNKDLEARVLSRTKDLDKAINALKFSNNDLQDEIAIRREAEEKANKLLSKEKMLNELKTRFVSMASHEFRTPLSTILSSVTLLSKYQSPVDKERHTKHTNRIRSSIRNLTSILNDFLSLDKLEQGIIEINCNKFNLACFFEEITEETKSIAKSGQEIYYNQQNIEKEFVSDKKIIKSIIVNLLSNAIKYSDENAVIKIKTGVKNGLLLISVADNGIGIPEVDQKHLFDRFFRATNAININGTGLGLNIVRKYIDLLNGEISFKSTEGKGTVFNVSIPNSNL
jgi:signal transduction histidine kinase